jgi:hypothetical protein
MAAMTYLWRHPKSGVYYFRQAIPADVRQVIGKTMIKKSLGTKDVAVAKRKVPSLALQTDAQFAAARERHSALPRRELSDAEIDFPAADYLRTQLAEDEAHRIEGSKKDDDLYKALKRQVEEQGGTAF